MDEAKLSNLKALLDDSYVWPGPYLFKFIVPAIEEQALLSLFSKGEVEKKPSKKGKYISISISIIIKESEEVLEIYRKVSHIKGLISL